MVQLSCQPPVKNSQVDFGWIHFRLFLQYENSLCRERCSIPFCWFPLFFRSNFRHFPIIFSFSSWKVSKSQSSLYISAKHNFPDLGSYSTSNDHHEKREEPTFFSLPLSMIQLFSEERCGSMYILLQIKTTQKNGRFTFRKWSKKETKKIQNDTGV